MRTRIHKFITAIAIGASGALMAQNFGEIHGKLLDERNEPIPFTSISAKQSEQIFSAQSDEDGRFVLKPLPPGAYEVRVVAMNIDRTIHGVMVSPDNITVLDDLVFTVAKQLDVVDVVRYRDRWTPPLIDKDQPGRASLHFTQFKHSAIRKDVVGLAATVGPGVYKAPNGDGLYFRGSRPENMCYYVDGMKVSDRLSGVPSEAINSISVYTGGLPAKYGDVTGGVVAIETKSYFDLYQQRNAGIR